MNDNESGSELDEHERRLREREAEEEAYIESQGGIEAIRERLRANPPVHDEPSLGRRAVTALPKLLLASPIVVAAVVALVTLFAGSWHLPAAHPWALYALVALPSTVPWLMGPLTELWLMTRNDQPRERTAEAWLRERLAALGPHDVALLETEDLRRLVFDRYAPPHRTLVVESEVRHARGAVGYAWAARSLAHLRLLGDRPALDDLPRVAELAKDLYVHAAAVLVGATLVGHSGLRVAALVLLPIAAAGQLAGSAFHLVATAAATRQLRADPSLEGPAAEVAIRQLRRESTAELLRAAAYLVVAAFAASASTSASASGIASFSAEALAAAPPLHGLDLALAAIAAVLCAAAAAPVIALWRDIDRARIIALIVASLVLTIARPALVALTWDQPFAVAHPWAIALGFAAVWPQLVAAALWLPGAIWRVTLGKLWPEPDPFVDKRLADRGIDRPPPTSPLDSLPTGLLYNVFFLVKAAGTSLPLPLAYLTVRALW